MFYFIVEEVVLFIEGKSYISFKWSHKDDITI